MRTVRSLPRLLAVCAAWPCAAVLFCLLTLAASAQTIVSTVQLPALAPVGQPVPIWMAGNASNAGASSAIVGLTWAENTDAWFPTWELQLVVSESAITNHMRSSAGRIPGTRVLTLDAKRPQWGHAYQTTLSFNPPTGAVSIHILDTTAQEGVYAGELRLLPQPDAAGWSDSAVLPYYIPRGLAWAVVEEQAATKSYIKLASLERNNANRIGVLVNVLEMDPGAEIRVQLVWEDAKQPQRIQLVRTAGLAGTAFFPFDTSRLSAGRMTVVLEYLINGTVSFSESKSVQIGAANIRLSDTAPYRLVVEADGPMQDFPILVRSQVTELVWDTDTGRYRTLPQQDITVLDQRIDLAAATVQLPLPQPEEFLPKPGLWQIRYSVQGGTAGTEIQTSKELLVANYPKPEVAPGQPFTIAVLPDTQYYSFESPQGGHPDMFLRQTQWLAEHAAERNIVFAVHMGDITEHNRAEEWQVAQRSMQALDGIVPYAMALGNHDIGPPGTRGTGFNTYFPDQPNYATFQVGATKYLVVALEFWPRDEVVAWADQIVSSHPDYQTIIITHTYTGADGKRRSSGYNYSVGQGTGAGLNTGADLWDKFIRRHANIFLVLSGHIPNTSVPRDIGIGDHGNAVYELLMDFQFDPNGGNGWLGLLQFSPEGDRIDVSVYSPYLNEYKHAEKSGFTVPFTIDLQSKAFTGPK